jgi:hypothetical protein
MNNEKSEADKIEEEIAETKASIEQWRAKLRDALWNIDTYKLHLRNLESKLAEVSK